MAKIADKYSDLYKLRHSCAHVLAQAVKRKYPTAKLGFGPPVDEGFYYDIHLPEPLTDADLKEIEKEMAKIVKSNFTFEKKDVTPDEARKLFSAKNETFKVETVDQLAGQEQISIVTDGDFTDLCKYPHAHSTGEIKAFKLTSIAGAYWKGIETNPVMQRIYGTAFFSQKELDDYLKMLVEAAKRDHRKIGTQLDLFHVYHETAGAGLIFYHPKGAMLRKLIEDYVREQHLKRGYSLVYTPNILKGKLWEISGHAENYRENMYYFKVNEEDYVVKPMNCPGHILIYQSQLRSYRDLPIRYFELGTVYRQEKAGVLHGLLRVRGFTQDDAHIFLSPDQIKKEVMEVIDFVFATMNDFGFHDLKIELSTQPEKFIGTQENWDKATAALKDALDTKGLKYDIHEGDGAFYGPKIDIRLKDAIGRAWQCGTIQCDFALPEKFELEYTGSDGKKHRPVMIHRAILGSLERFMGTLIEHYAGAFPLWLSPMQISIIPVAQAHEAYAEKISDTLKAEGFRIEIQSPSETLGSRIRTAQNEKIPYMMILGDKEIQAEKISVRSRVKGDLGQSSLSEFIRKAKEEVTARTS